MAMNALELLLLIVLVAALITVLIGAISLNRMLGRVEAQVTLIDRQVTRINKKVTR